MHLLALLVSADMREGFSSLALPALPAPTAPRSCFPSPPPFPIEQKARMPVLSHSGLQLARTLLLCGGAALLI